MKRMKRLAEFFEDNSLSIVFIVLFAGCFLGQALTGQRLENGLRAVHGQAPMALGRYVSTGSFLQGVFSNWQAAVLQLGALIFFGTYLHQKGAPHSKKKGRQGTRHADPGKPGESPDQGGDDPEVGAQDGGNKTWLQRNSLAVTFFSLFVLMFVFHFLSGLYAYNEELTYDHQAEFSAMAFARSSKFWFETLQTWQAEFMAIALYVLLSVFLRQEGSPESKPVNASNDDTGHPNE
jgi:hypothetical protein